MAYLAIGVLAGGAATYAGASFFRALDEGISYSYRCDELDRQAAERDVLHRIATASWVGKDVGASEAMLRAAGLQPVRKGDEALLAGASGVSFALKDGRVSGIEISGIDGRCPSPQGEN